jgi:hypothetical protein
VVIAAVSGSSREKGSQPSYAATGGLFQKKTFWRAAMGFAFPPLSFDETGFSAY